MVFFKITLHQRGHHSVRGGGSRRVVVYQSTAGMGIPTNARLLLTLLSSGSGPLNFNSCLVAAEASLSASFLYMIAANPAIPPDAVHSLFEECQMLLAWCTSNSERISPADLQGVKDWLGNICQLRIQRERISAHFWEYMYKASRMSAACEQKVE